MANRTGARLAAALLATAFAAAAEDGVPCNADLTDQGFALVCSNCATLSPLRIELDDYDPSGNGVLEDGEDALLLLSWHNYGAAPVGPLTGTVTSTSPIQLPLNMADYGIIPAGGDGFAAYGIFASGPRPAAHWDAVVNEALSSGDAHDWTVHIGPTFADVAPVSAEYLSVETIVHHRITGGCSGTQYCPAASITRAQMAVFVLLAKEGPAYLPPACTTPVFTDVPAADPFCRWIEELARRGVVSGCGSGAYCPSAGVTREQMSVFLLRTLDPALTPPACSPAAPRFTDVPASSPFCTWIEELARRQVVSGCGGGN